MLCPHLSNFRQLINLGDRQQCFGFSFAQGSAQLPDSSVDDGAQICLGGLEGGLRLGVPGAPVFSLALDSEACGSGLRQVFLGTAAKEILAWEPPQPELVANVQLGGHTGWVRALAQHGRWLFRYVLRV